MVNNTNSDIEAKVKEIITYCIAVDINDISGQTHFVDDLYADSLDLMDILFGISDAFNINCNENDLPMMLTVTDACSIVERHLLANK